MIRRSPVVIRGIDASVGLHNKVVNGFMVRANASLAASAVNVDRLRAGNRCCAVVIDALPAAVAEILAKSATSGAGVPAEKGGDGGRGAEPAKAAPADRGGLVVVEGPSGAGEASRHLDLEMCGGVPRRPGCALRGAATRERRRPVVAGAAPRLPGPARRDSSGATDSRWRRRPVMVGLADDRAGDGGSMRGHGDHGGRRRRPVVFRSAAGAGTSHFVNYGTCAGDQHGDVRARGGRFRGLPVAFARFPPTSHSWGNGAGDNQNGEPRALSQRELENS